MLLLLWVCFYPVKAQKASGDSVKNDTIWKLRAKNHMYLELLGTGLFGSVDYERVIHNRSKSFYTFRVGVLALPPYDNSVLWHTATSKAYYQLLTVGLTHNKLRRRNRYLEYGIGATWAYAFRSGYLFADDSYPYRETMYNAVGIFGILGYRWQKATSRFYLRTSATPGLLYSFQEENRYGGLYFIPTISASVGYQFKNKK